jgi:hypothetical protein
MAPKPMPAEQLTIRLDALITTALGDRGPGPSVSAKVIAETIVDTACARPGGTGAKVVETMITRMRSRLAEHGSSSST